MAMITDELTSLIAQDSDSSNSNHRFMPPAQILEDTNILQWSFCRLLMCPNFTCDTSTRFNRGIHWINVYRMSITYEVTKFLC